MHSASLTAKQLLQELAQRQTQLSAFTACILPPGYRAPAFRGSKKDELARRGCPEACPARLKKKAFQTLAPMA